MGTGDLKQPWDSDRVVYEPPGDSVDRKPLTADDLLGIVDVAGLTLSPDGRRVAYRVQWASGNDYRAEWHVASTMVSGETTPLADAGRPVLEDGCVEGVEEYGGRPPVAAWSPDGRRLAFQVHRDDRFQLWQAEIQGDARMLCELDGVLRAVRYATDGTHLLVRTSPQAPTPVRAPRPANGTGVLLGASSRPDAGVTGLPATPEPAEPRDWVVDLVTGVPRETEAPELDPEHVDAAVFATFSPDGTHVAFLTDDEDENLYVAPAAAVDQRRLVTDLHAAPHPLGEDHVPVLWWSSDGLRMYFRAREAANDSTLYTVALGGGDPEPVIRDAGELTDFVLAPAHDIAVCREESATRPAEVVAVDLSTGNRRRLTDLNPSFAHRRFGRVRRVEVTNHYGDRTWANIVHPVDFTAQQPYPCVVTTYSSRGFLRGATGDEYPIHVLSAHGFVVIDLMRPRGYEIDDPDSEHTCSERFEALYKDLDGPVSTIRVLIEGLVAEGLVDPSRVGISGLSNGSDIATFALETTDLFAAASLSGFSHEDEYSYQLFGPGFDTFWDEWGLTGGPDGPYGEHWPRRSPGVEGITAAVLTHDSEAEYLASMSAYSRLKRAGRPVEMHVYPREDHVKIQPLHRAEIYRRNVDWFDFWLRGHVDPDPEKHEQYRRWWALHDARD